MRPSSSLRHVASLLVFAAAALGSAQTASEPLTLERATQLAIESSKPLRRAVAGYAQARGGLREVNAAFLPQISLGAQATKFDRENVVDFGRMMGGPSLPVTIAERWNPALTATLGLQIDISGAVRSASNQAEFHALAARIEIDRVRNQLAFEVRSAFFDVARAQGQVKVASDQLAAVQKRLDDTRLFEKVGNVPKFDVVSAERDLAEADQALLAARTSEELAKARLRIQLGLTGDAEVQLDTAALDPVKVEPDGTLESLLDDARRNRPELLELQATVEAAKHGVHYARRSMMPSLSAGLSYTYQPNHGAFTLPRTTAATVSLSIPLFDGGLARARVEQAQAGRAVAEADLAASAEQVELQVRSAYLNLTQAQARARVADAAMVQAQEAYRLAQLRYSIGVSQASVMSPQLELALATAALTNAANQRTNASIDILLAKAQLDFAVGRFAPKPTENKPK